MIQLSRTYLALGQVDRATFYYNLLALGRTWVEHQFTPSIWWVPALLAAVAGSALPEEMLFRGYMMSTLDGRARRWARSAASRRNSASSASGRSRGARTPGPSRSR